MARVIGAHDERPAAHQGVQGVWLGVAIGLALLGLLFMVGWFLVVGVDEERWKEQAARERASIWA